jgi:photosystem II stability/assembly factor-like uncharacterized protein
VILPHRFPLRSLVTGLATFILIGLISDFAPSADVPAGERKQQIADLQKQIDELTRKLNELRKGDVPPVTQLDGALNPDWLKALSWRSIGPATMGGRITALTVYEADPTVWYAATASGGLLKTVNNGVTFEHQFDKEATVSIGDVCVAPSDKNIVWVGTGENNPRNSVTYGDGVYKSTDGGKTWKHMGLKQSYQIGKIAIHPKDPNIVYVGALGRLYGPNEERGLFKTTDGGKTWEKVFYLDASTGVIDLAMHPADPETLLVAMWDRWRDEYDSYAGGTPPEGYDGYDPMRKWGKGAGIYKTTDGGKNFARLTQGLPTCQMGRIGLDYHRKNPNVVFAIIDTERYGMGPPQPAVQEAYFGVQGEDVPDGVRLTQIFPGSPAEKAGLKTGDVVQVIDSKLIPTYKDLGERMKDHKPGDKISVGIVRNREVEEVAVALEVRPGAPSGKRPFAERLAGQQANLQDKQGKDGFQTGGVYRSADGGESWMRVNSINPRPMYFSQVRVDPSDEKHVYVLGVNLHRSKDGGRSFSADGGKGVHADHHALWIDPRDGRHMIGGTDGGIYVTHDRMAHWDFHNHMALGQFYHVCVDQHTPYRVYGGLQDNGSWGGPSRTLRTTGPANDDWVAVGGGDGFVCRVDAVDPDVVYAESQGGVIYRRNLKTGQFSPIAPKAGKGGGYRFNWNTPFILSSHNPSIFYSGGNVVFRSLKKGDDLQVISPEITRTKRGSATALSESPRNPDVLWAGTDDGFVWVTKDGGKTWSNVTPLPKNVGEKNKDQLPGPRWVSTIEASRFADGRAYVAFDAHRSDDDHPYLFVTEDYGQTWKNSSANLPVGSTRCLREDVKNAELLFCGTEFACFVSVDRGKSWQKLNNNLPTVAIHELAIHPTAGEMVAATHGRSLWVLDIAPLRQMTANVLKSPAHLYEPMPAIFWRIEPNKGSPFGNGSRRFYGENPVRGAVLYYSLGQKAGKVDLKLVDIAGKTVRQLGTKSEPGLHKIVWDMRTAGQPGPAKGPQPKGPPPGGPAATAGVYRLVLTVDGIDYFQPLRVEGDPTLPGVIVTEEDGIQPRTLPEPEIK